MGVDEKSPGRGSEYFTIVCNLDTKTVEWIGDGKDGPTLDEYWKRLTPSDLEAIECVAMDMGKACISSTLRSVP
ncbi:MAG: transposase [Sandaracinaceae bacterium]|nr:transposase [Sandaracinaceae bacterium]